MFEFMKGTLADKAPHKAVVEIQGIGYRLAIPLSTYTRLPDLGKPVQLFLSHQVREDSETLYAFLTKEERDLFELVITVSGIGPKTGLAIIGHTDQASFQRAVSASDTRLLSKIPGIGKKTAERLVIEMRDKFKHPQAATDKPALRATGLLGDALSALIHLGYSTSDAQKAVQAALEERKDETDLGKIISTALQKI